MRRVALIGAGYISHVHAEALRTIAATRVTTIIDPAVAAAQKLAAACGAAHVFPSLADALAADTFDCAHILVPPDRHAEVAFPLLQAGKPVFIEKPLTATGEECRVLLQAAERTATTLGVNQNFVYHPAFAQLRRMVEARALGRPNFIGCIYNVPLRQLAARQFGHWMFRAPVNILLEQAVHPLSQVAALAGTIGEVAVLAGPGMQIAPDVPFYTSLNVSLACADLPAQLRFAVGQSFPFWQITAVCDDGVLVADILANRLFSYRQTRWLEAVDGLVSGARTASAMFAESCRNATQYAASTMRLIGRSDAFFQSMRGSIGAFHHALDAGTVPPLDGRFGAMLVDACERIGDRAFRRTGAAATAISAPPTAPAPAVAAPTAAAPTVGAPPVAAPTPATAAATAVAAIAVAAPAAHTAANTTGCDVAVLGGTGFIGAHVVRRFVTQGARVSVMARSIRNLPAVFHDPAVTLHPGDVRDGDAVAAAIGDAPVVINLAHGGASGSWDDVRTALVGSAETVARTCLARGVRRLIHVGSIASLYLGAQDAPVTGATPPDPQADQRADYARAKAMADRLLLTMHASDGLPVCILRPGVVVGDGGPPLHSGLGFYNNDQHCIGWNAGRNPLPFVLVDDVAEAIVLASRADGIDGRCYNLVGDVRWSARDYFAALGQALERPLRFHPQSATMLWLRECGKWLVKRATGRNVPLPSKRDLLSRGMMAKFDCSDAWRDLGWQPVADPAVFRERAILVQRG